MIYLKKWYWQLLLENWKFRFENARWRAFDCANWALPPVKRGEIFRLGPHFYVIKLRIRNKVFAQSWKPRERNEE